MSDETGEKLSDQIIQKIIAKVKSGKVYQDQNEAEDFIFYSSTGKLFYRYVLQEHQYVASRTVEDRTIELVTDEEFSKYFKSYYSQYHAAVLSRFLEDE